MNEGPRALARGIGDPGEAFIDQLAGAGAAAVEIVGQVASVGMFGIGFLVWRSWLWIDYLSSKAGVDLQIEQRRTQRFAVRVERQRPRHAAAERAGHHEIQRGDIGQLIADHLAFDNTGKMRLHPRAGDLLQQQRIMLLVIGDHGDVGGVALVAGAGMGDLAQLHRSRPHKLDSTALRVRAAAAPRPPRPHRAPI